MTELYKKIHEIQVTYTNDILEASKTLQRELQRVNKLWDKTETMRFTLFSKKEILKLLDDEIYDFNYQVKKRTAQLLMDIDNVIKSETGGSNE
jgi:secreted Zn-dependent insulinase-like peptidase